MECGLRVACCYCMTAGWGETEVYWMSRPGAWLLCSISIFLRVACFLCPVFLEPFLLTVIKRNIDHLVGLRWGHRCAASPYFR